MTEPTITASFTRGELQMKTIDAGLGAADTYMCTTPDGTIVEVPEG